MISPLQAPCYECDQRTEKCHIWCKAYAEYRSIRKDYNEKEREFNLTRQYYEASLKEMFFKLQLK
jgi:uncharacterized protein YeaO (DUF488 family)